MINILFTNAGRRTYLIKYAIDLIKDGYDLNIYVSDTSKYTASFWVDSSIRRIITPKVKGNEKEYIDALMEECIKSNIGIIIPLMDYEIPFLSKNINKFKSIGIKVIVSDYKLVNSLLNKEKTEKLCIKSGINYPKTWYSINKFNGVFPLIKKNIYGSGSVGLTVIRDKNQLVNFKEGKEILQQFIDGQEYGIDILNDLNGNFLHCCVKKKILMRSGETDKAEIINNEKYVAYAKKISKSFRHVGNLDVDFIEERNGNIYFIDFNPRFGGLYPFTHLSGCNYLKILIDICLNRKFQLPAKPNEISGMKGITVYYFKKDVIEK